MKFGHAMGLTAPTGIPKPDGLSHESLPAFSEDLRQRIANLALTGILGNQFYTPQTAQIDDLVQVCREAAVADPAFLLRAAQVSRRANFKLFPKLAIAALVSTLDGKAWDPMEQRVVEILSTYAPGQLLELALTFKGKVFGKGLGRRAQRVIGAAIVRNAAPKLENWTLSDREDVRRLLRLVHPEHLSAKQASDLSYALGDKPKPTTPRQTALEALKAAVTGEDITDEMLAETIGRHELPFNATKGIVGHRGAAVWKAILHQMSPLQVLLNLKSLHDKGAITKASFGHFVDALVASERALRLMPHDILRPYAHAPGFYQDDLVRLLGKLAGRPLPGLEGKRVGISLDVSPSMYGHGSASDYGVDNWMLAATLATPIIASCPDRVLSFFDIKAAFEGMFMPESRSFYYGQRDQVGMPNLKGRPADATLKALLDLKFNGSGTSVASAIQLHTENAVKLDVLFLFTDEQENAAIHACNAWNTYRAHVNPRAHLVVVNVSNVKWHAFKHGLQGVTIIQSVTPMIYEQLQRYDQSPVELIDGYTGA